MVKTINSSIGNINRIPQKVYKCNILKYIMKKSFVIGLIFIVLIIVLGIAYYGLAKGAGINGNAVNSNSGKSNVYTIEMSEKGFSPNSLEIKQGDTVKFVNVGNIGQWPASAKHPTHTVYPGSDIKKCGTVEEAHIFDACKNIQPGESWSFTFNEKGTWGYHDHSKKELFGKIVVN